MALTDEVVARLSTERLKQLTNPDDRTATSYNATRLAAACNDAMGELRTYAGMDYDGTKTEMVAVAVRTATVYLRQYQGHDVAQDLEACRVQMRQLAAQVAWIPPTSTSLLEPSSDARQEIPRRPDFDSSNFDRVIPRAPRATYLDNR